MHLVWRPGKNQENDFATPKTYSFYTPAKVNIGVTFSFHSVEVWPKQTMKEVNHGEDLRRVGSW